MVEASFTSHLEPDFNRFNLTCLFNWANYSFQ